MARRKQAGSIRIISVFVVGNRFINLYLVRPDSSGDYKLVFIADEDPCMRFLFFNSLLFISGYHLIHKGARERERKTCVCKFTLINFVASFNFSWSTENIFFSNKNPKISEL